MRLLGRAVGAIVLVLSAVGIGCCAAGAIGVWILRPEVARRVEHADARVEAALQRASEANHSVRRAIETARDAVQRLSKASADLGAEPEKNRLTSGVLRKLIHQQVGPNINDLRGRLATLSDAAVAVASMLESFQDVSPGQAGRVNPDKLARATDQASQLSAALQKLQAVIGEGDKLTTEREVAAASNDVDLVLQKCQATVDDWQSDLDAAREELARLKARVLGWLTSAAVAVTVLCAWGVLSQMSLGAHAWKWFTKGFVIRPESVP